MTGQPGEYKKNTKTGKITGFYDPANPNSNNGAKKYEFIFHTPQQKI